MYILAIVFGFLYIYHIDYTTLVSYDEAWYASIARTMFEQGDWLKMYWDGEPFYDHPPMGMWLMKISYAFFGVNAFAARLPSVLLGIGTLLLIYATGFELTKKKIVGFAAGLILGTAIWFAARAQSGNLDTIFTFFYIASVWTSLRAVKNPKWFLATGASFGALIMTKTLVGISALPLIVYASYPAWTQPKSWKYILGGTGIWGLIVLPWYMFHMQTYSEFQYHHFTNIGTRRKELIDYFNYEPAKQVLFYLHMGVLKWYKVWVVALAWLSARVVFAKGQRKSMSLLILWNIGLLFPFLSSPETELWHLIPVYLPMALIISYSGYDVAQLTDTYIKKNFKKFKKYSAHLPALFVLGIIAIASLQIRTIWNEIIPEYRYTSEQVKLAERAGSYGMKLYVDGDFQQTATFYAGQDVTRIRDAAQDDPEYKNTLIGQFRTDEEDFLVITIWWQAEKLDELDLEYEEYDRLGDFVLIGRQSNNSEMKNEKN